MKSVMNNKLVSRILALMLVAASMFTVCGFAVDVPVKAQLNQEISVFATEDISMDYTNISEGIISIKYTGGAQVPIKMQITKVDGVTYTYNLNNTGNYETFSFTEGDGDYVVNVFERVEGEKYFRIFGIMINVKLRNELLPFLYSNQYVNFNEESKVIAKAKELTKDMKSDTEIVSAIYDFTVNNLKYDLEKANTVQSGYLPVVDSVLESGTAICFDYAAVMTAMLRSQGIPCKLVVGYSNSAYHAWVNVYVKEKGWISEGVYSEGENWKLLDPTFVSSSNSDPIAIKYTTDSTNYIQKYAY